MSRTRKDSSQVSRVEVEVIKRSDKAFEIIVSRGRDRETLDVDERGLSEVLCVRFGYCGAEYDAILRQLGLTERTVLRF